MYIIIFFNDFFVLQSVIDARRSLSFDVSTSEDQDTTKDIEEHVQLSVGHIPAEAQLRSDCENLWQELNSVSSARTGKWYHVSNPSDLQMAVLYFFSELLKLDFLIYCFFMKLILIKMFKEFHASMWLVVNE